MEQVWHESCHHERQRGLLPWAGRKGAASTEGADDMSTTQSHVAHWILAGYLAIYAAAIAVGTLATHNGALVAVHSALLAIGAMALRMILPEVLGRRL